MFRAGGDEKGGSFPVILLQSAFEIRDAVPNELNRNRKNEEAKDLVDGSDRAWAEAPHQRASKPEEKTHADCDQRHPNHHTDISGEIVDMRG